jgi:hypothetical protein
MHAMTRRSTAHGRGWLFWLVPALFVAPAVLSAAPASAQTCFATVGFATTGCIAPQSSSLLPPGPQFPIAPSYSNTQQEQQQSQTVNVPKQTATSSTPAQSSGSSPAAAPAASGGGSYGNLPRTGSGTVPRDLGIAGALMLAGFVAVRRAKPRLAWLGRSTSVVPDPVDDRFSSRVLGFSDPF